MATGVSSYPYSGNNTTVGLGSSVQSSLTVNNPNHRSLSLTDQLSLGSGGSTGILPGGCYPPMPPPGNPSPHPLDSLMDIVKMYMEILKQPPQAQIPPITRWNPNGGSQDYARTLYRNILGRNAESQQVVNDWAGGIDANGPAYAVKGFFNSPEFQSKNKSPEETVELLYRSILFRDSDAGGKEHWVNQLKAGRNLNEIIDDFFNSPEYQQKQQAGQVP